MGPWYTILGKRARTRRVEVCQPLVAVPAPQGFGRFYPPAAQAPRSFTSSWTRCSWTIRAPGPTNRPDATGTSCSTEMVCNVTPREKLQKDLNPHGFRSFCNRHSLSMRGTPNYARKGVSAGGTFAGSPRGISITPPQRLSFTAGKRREARKERQADACLSFLVGV